MLSVRVWCLLLHPIACWSLFLVTMEIHIKKTPWRLLPLIFFNSSKINDLQLRVHCSFFPVMQRLYDFDQPLKTKFARECVWHKYEKLLHICCVISHHFSKPLCHFDSTSPWNDMQNVPYFLSDSLIVALTQWFWRRHRFRFLSFLVPVMALMQRSQSAPVANEGGAVWWMAH